MFSQLICCRHESGALAWRVSLVASGPSPSTSFHKPMLPVSHLYISALNLRASPRSFESIITWPVDFCSFIALSGCSACLLGTCCFQLSRWITSQIGLIRLCEPIDRQAGVWELNYIYKHAWLCSSPSISCRRVVDEWVTHTLPNEPGFLFQTFNMPFLYHWVSTAQHGLRRVSTDDCHCRICSYHYFAG
ncbi:hypothetical protein IW262DRAFT_743635 [Armillaria fumosa]|nr:hypothetical protein IW262DRAFT_743635 [Armillaria fumosa]